MSAAVGAFRRRRYWVLSHLPGRRGARYLKKWSKTRRPEVEAAFDRALEGARGRVCIDLGANVGEFTVRMAECAAKVYAFEPDPWTAARLREAVAGRENVEVIEAAAGVAEGRMPFYRSARFRTDPGKGALATTLLPDKANVEGTASGEVAVIDFCAFLERLDTDVWLLKIDIEGGEVALLEALLDRPALLRRIGHVFVETHETQVPALAARSRALRRRVARLGRPAVDMDWH